MDLFGGLGVFNMKGAVIQAVVERGNKTYDLSVVNGLANSLASARFELKAGAASNLELTFTPPFEVAKLLIESGILGVGFPTVEDLSSVLKGFTSGAGVLKALGSSSLLGNLSGEQIEGRGGNAISDPAGTGQAVSIKAKWWYEDYGPKSSSPTFSGMLKPPRISFGEEITITMVATGTTGLSAAMQETNKSFVGQTIYDIVNTIAKKYLKVDVTWGGSSAAKARSRKYNEQLDGNMLMYINECLVRVGCVAFFGLSEPKGMATRESLYIVSHEDVNNSTPVCTLGMYIQIDPANPDHPIYGITGFDTSLTHASLLGQKGGAVHTTTDPNTKKALLNRTDLDTNKRAIVGNTVGGKTRVGPVNESGVAQGAAVQESELASRHLKGLNRNKDNDNMYEETVEMTNDEMEKAWRMDLTGPGVPWLYPMSLVRVDIGGIRHLTGVYKLIDIAHTIDSNGAETHYTVYKNLGFNSTQSTGKKQAPDVKPASVIDVINPISGTSVGDVIRRTT